MLELILGIFGSGGFGSLVGLVGGYANRKLDLEVKRLELSDVKDKRTFDLEYAKTEFAGKLQLATVEAEAQVEAAGYEAMKASYDFARTSAQDGLVDKLSKAVRPLVTLALLVGTVVVFWQVQGLVDELQLQMKSEEILKLYVLIIEWVLFQAGVCTGWWFAMRPGKLPSIRGA